MTILRFKLRMPVAREKGELILDIGVDLKDLFYHDTEKLRQLLLGAGEDIWEKNDIRQKSYEVHSSTKSIVYVWSNDMEYQTIKAHIAEDDPDPLHQEVWTIANKIKALYGPKARISRLVLAKLVKRAVIAEHMDVNKLARIHRCHLPVITHPDCLFTINSTDYHFKPGYAFEFNNQRRHGVKNNSDVDRVHLICDVLDKDFLTLVRSRWN